MPDVTFWWNPFPVVAIGVTLVIVLVSWLYEIGKRKK